MRIQTCLLWAGLLAAGGARAGDESGWISMFDGKTLDGWKAGDNPQSWSAKDGTIVQVQGTAPKSSSIFTGPTQVVRQYANVGGYPQATHVRAVSNSFMFGQTIVKIDYQDYQVQLRPTT